MKNTLIIVGLFLFLTSCSSKVSQIDQGNIGTGSCTIKIAWDANTESDLAGYTVHVGTISGTYDVSPGQTTATQYDITGAQCGTTYFVAVTAFDTSGNESDYSNEVSTQAK